MATKARITTNYGDINLELDYEKAPLTVTHFVRYILQGQYKDTIFHRVIPKFMIQGGGFDELMNQRRADVTVMNEAKNGLKNDHYTIAMARTSDPHSASSQFFINTTDNDFLNHPGQDGWGYAVFGKVVDGQEVVDAIGKVSTHRKGMHADVPKEPVRIQGIAITAVSNPGLLSTEGFVYSAKFTPAEPGEEGFVVTFRDIPEATTQGDTMDEAMALAADVLADSLGSYVEKGKMFPIRSNRQPDEVDVVAKFIPVLTEQLDSEAEETPQ